ncbi:hypothetical protein MLD38_031919 [Melastoma candidum]|uniref:Uncharacterized protein n=2 Tax=Melastoma candidum TaxID=119954 RepID=A0ACB9MSA1_9MYRT|nr:hypothetical protein MLD38_031919 [Melastoma candidum]
MASSQYQRQGLISLMKSCTQKSQLHQIHAHVIRSLLHQDQDVVLRFLARVALPPFHDLVYARRVFNNLWSPTTYQYNTMIRAYSMCGDDDLTKEGFLLYKKMKEDGVPLDPLTASFTIKCCAKDACFHGGVQVHGGIVTRGHQHDGLLMTTLMDFYSGCGRLDDACMVFDETTVKDTVAWNVLISCYLRNGRTRDALRVFDHMVAGSSGCEPDDVTCLHVLQACASLNALEFGERVHDYMKERGYDDAINLRNSLITMYSRCGCMDKAYTIFQGMPVKNVVSWTALIAGLAMNGNGVEAIDAFRQMLRAGVSPDAQTFTGVLSACSHCGLVDEGLLVFEKIRKQFGITPNIHHYGCMVDLMGRAGQLDRAYELILSMDSKPDSTIWRTLLGACRIHRHVTLGERVINHLIELKAQEAGDYVLLLNMYSSAGEWEKVTEVRKFMKENGVQTTPGCTTMELGGVLHEFTSDDTSHPRNSEIYGSLNEIGSQLRIAGYVPIISSELHNLTVEDKGYRLSYHGEKLAIAFGILVTPPGTTLRLANNLRICVDCHEFAKFVSSVYDRMVIIRDRSRFHHVRRGHCSCNDYW